MKTSTLRATPAELEQMRQALTAEPFTRPTLNKLADFLAAKFPQFKKQSLYNSSFLQDYVTQLPKVKKVKAVEAVTEGKTTYTESAEKATFEGSYRDTDFSTPEAYMKSKGVDFERWKVKEIKLTSWNGFYKDKNAEAKTVLMHSCTAILVPNNQFDIAKARAGVIEAMQQHAPRYHSFKRQTLTDGHLLVLDPADSHFGKLAHFYSTGDTYTLDTARERIIQGFEGLLNKAQGFPIDRILLILGNDMLHVDNTARTTTAGTRQDTDGMWYEAFMCAKKTFVTLIEGLATIADVDVVFNPSNHDYQSGWMLFDSLQSWFHRVKNISFNGSMQHRKYYQYGQSLIGTTHGDGVKPHNLMHYMPNEAKELWAQSTYRYWYYHHIHHLDKIKYQSGKDYVGGTVQSVRSISGTDVWHDKAGFTGVPKALEAFIHSRQHGQIAQLTHIF